MIVAALGWLIGCTPDEPADPPVGSDTDTDADTDTDTDADTDTDTDTDADTDTDPTGGTVVSGAVRSAGCAPQAGNPLRFDCSAALDGALGATWTLSQAGGRTRVFTTEPSDAPSLVAWGFAPDTPTTWSVVVDGGEGSGTTATGTLPAGVGDLVVTASGSPEQVDTFAVPYGCGGLAGVALIGAEGNVLWYEQQVHSGFGTLQGIAGFDWTDGRILYGLDAERLIELTPTGEVLFDVGGLDRPIHHDLAIGARHRFVLNAAVHGNSVVDGFYVLDDAGAVVAEWDLADHVEVGVGLLGAFWFSEFPNAGDWSHANSIEPDGDGHVLISLKHLNALLRVVSDPDAPDFGAIDWVLGGSEVGLDADFRWVGRGDFLDQHHVARLSTGGLSVFDNLSAKRSRALLLTVDEAAGTVAEDASWELSSRCPIQGSVYELPGGNLLSMCQDDGAVWELRRGSPTPVAKFDVLCRTTTSGAGHLARALPVTLEGL